LPVRVLERCRRGLRERRGHGQRNGGGREHRSPDPHQSHPRLFRDADCSAHPDQRPIGPWSDARVQSMRAMDLPRTEGAVVVAGGVVGCSTAYTLARRGLADVVVVERETVGSGTTSKAAGGIRVQFPTETEIRFSLEAIRVFERFADEFGVDPGYKKIGYLFLLSDPADVRGFEARIALQRRLGV